MKLPFSIIAVQFDGEGSKEYSYYCDFEVAKDDLLVVLARGEYQVVTVAKVKGLSKAARDRANTLVVCPINHDSYELRKERLTAYFAVKEKLAEIKEQHDEFQVYQTMAKNDPEMQKLLDELALLSTKPGAWIEKKDD